MANYAKGVVVDSTPESLKIRLGNNVVVETKPRLDLEYMDPVLVAYDFSTNSVREVFRPDEVPTDINQRPEVLEEKGEPIGDEEYIANLLASKRIREYD